MTQTGPNIPRLDRRYAEDWYLDGGTFTLTLTGEQLTELKESVIARYYQHLNDGVLDAADRAEYCCDAIKLFELITETAYPDDMPEESS